MIGTFRLVKRFTSSHPAMFRFQKADHIFVHDSLMAKTVLKLIPQRITPNQVTAFRILFTPLAVYIISIGIYDWGAGLFLLLAFTDAIDGSLARTRNMVTQWGMMFDPLADKLLIGSMVLILVFKYFNFWLGFVILGLEIVFIITALIASYKFKKVKMANGWGKIKMILQVFAVCLTLFALVWQIPYLLTAAAWVFGLAIGFAIVSLFAQGI